MKNNQTTLDVASEPDIYSKEIQDMIATMAFNKPFTGTTSAIISKAWQPELDESDESREEVWFDDIHRYLYVDFRKSCGTCLRIGSWKQGLIISRWNSLLQCWEREDGDPGIPLPLNTQTRLKKSFIDDFIYEIPRKVLAAISPFQWRQFVLLKMACHCPETLELIESNPVLAWLLADALAEKEIPITEGCSWVFKKRKEILEFVAGTSSESAIKIISKIKFNSYTKDDCSTVKIFLSESGNLEPLRWAQIIPGSILCMHHMHQDFMQWLSSIPNEAGSKEIYPDRVALIIASHIWADTKTVGFSQNIPDPLSRMMKCKSQRDLKQLHDQWCGTLNSENEAQRIKRFISEFGTDRFPVPPVAGTAEIVPIMTIQDLIKEGSEMHNCVSSYAPRIMRKSSYIYKVLAPERVTMEISINNGIYTLRQLKTAMNGEPSEKTKQVVQQWLKGDEK